MESPSAGNRPRRERSRAGRQRDGCSAAREYRMTVAALKPHLRSACLEIWERKSARVVTSAEAAAELGSLGIR